MTTAGVHDNGRLSFFLSCGHSNGSCLLAASVTAFVGTASPPSAAARVDQGCRAYATHIFQAKRRYQGAQALMGHADLASAMAIPSAHEGDKVQKLVNRVKRYRTRRRPESASAGIKIAVRAESICEVVDAWKGHDCSVLSA